jgi:hypothetical protein
MQYRPTYIGDEPDKVELGVENEQGQDSSDAGRRERRKNRDRMDVTLVEDAEQDVAAAIAMRISIGSFDSDCRKISAVPASVPLIEAGMSMRATVALISSAAWPSVLPGCKLNEMVEVTNKP